MTIQQNRWRTYYYQWATEKGETTRVKPKVFLGMRGWGKYVKKTKVGDQVYLGEVWESEDERGNKLRTVFRIPYDNVLDDVDNVYDEKEVFTGPNEGTNWHTDGIAAYESGKDRDIDRSLLRLKNEQFRDRIRFLRNWFRALNNMDDELLRLGIQYYLRALQSPMLQTRREWKEFKQSHSQGEYIISVLQQQNLM